MLTSALDHYRRQQRISASGLIAARRSRSRGPAAVAATVAAYQLLATRDAVRSVPQMLEEQGIDAPPVADVAIGAVAGVASDGRPLETLFEQAETDWQFGLMVATQLQDAARMVSGLSIASRPGVSGYVRMLNPPSCSRCAVLAGKWFKWNQGFERHPRCDCRHIPSTEDRFDDLRTHPDQYFDSLSKAEQDRIFTQKGAEAIRDGADMGQVVNARRGMQKAQIGGRNVLLTTEGTTVRGLAGKQLGDLRKMGGSPYRRSRRPRLMPETIYDVAEDRADAIRLLKANSYLL